MIIGKWRKGEYRIEALLGQGANGKVYLVRRASALYAMKIGFDPLDLQSEVNALQALQQSSRTAQQYLLEVDDYYVKGQPYPFYVMKYVKGQHVSSYIQKNGLDWLQVIGRSLLEKLAELHRSGWVFGDIKPSNILVSEYGKVDLIDFGGVTAAGRSVKQFTELYDRGYWNAGSRTANPAYDLFSVAVLLLQLADPQRKLDEPILPQMRNLTLLMEIADRAPACRKIRAFLKKALQGGYVDADEALADWRKQANAKEGHASTGVMVGWISGLFAASLLLFASVLFIVLR
nr:AarF/UbiB family protein [Paenibacillus turpanensis]